MVWKALLRGVATAVQNNPHAKARLEEASKLAVEKARLGLAQVRGQAGKFRVEQFLKNQQTKSGENATPGAPQPNRLFQYFGKNDEERRQNFSKWRTKIFSFVGLNFMVLIMVAQLFQGLWHMRKQKAEQEAHQRKRVAQQQQQERIHERRGSHPQPLAAASFAGIASQGATLDAHRVNVEPQRANMDTRVKSDATITPQSSQTTAASDPLARRRTIWGGTKEGTLDAKFVDPLAR